MGNPYRPLPMHIFLTGSTGVLGSRLVSQLTDAGHTVYGLVRDESGATLVDERGGVPYRGDVLEPHTLESAVEEAGRIDAVIHAATALPTAQKPTVADWEHNERVRLEGARNLVAAFDACSAHPDRFLFPSVVWVARQPDGSPFDESAPRYPDRSTRSVAAVEDFLADAGPTHGFEPTVLRCGLFYAPDGAYTRRFGQNLLSRDLPIVGGGIVGRKDGTLSMLHADDAARAFSTALEAGIDGLYHVVDDEPVTPGTYFRTFADALEAPPPRRIPGWLARYVIGSETTALLTKPMATSSDRFRAATGWEPRYPTYRDGLEQILETWTTEGTLRSTPDGYVWEG